MDWIRSFFSIKTNNESDCPRCKLPTGRELQRTRAFKYNNSYKRNRARKYYRYGFIFQSLIILFNCNPVKAQGNSATAAPVATSSGSVTNQAIQMLTGPFPTNTYGGGISCQGPVFNLSPIVTNSHTFNKPREFYYTSPVYDPTDDDDNGVPDNPGNILYWNDYNRTGQKDNFALNLGFSATFSVPLDRELQRRCKRAALTQIKYMEQLTANKILDFQLNRLKHCAEQRKLGISFAKNSAAYSICSDVVFSPDPGQVLPHKHAISSSSTVAAPSSPDKN